MSKEPIRIADAIPEPPASYYRTVEATLKQTLESEAAEQQKKRSVTLASFGTRRIRLTKRALVALVAAAILLVATTAVAAAAWIVRDFYSPAYYMDQSKEERVQNENAIPEVEQMIESAAPVTGNAVVRMLPELAKAEKLNEWRVKMGQKAYEESEWAWVREIRPEVEEVLYDGASLSYRIRLNTDHGDALAWDSGYLDAWVESTWFTPEGGVESEELYGGTGIMPESCSETGATIHTAHDGDELPEDFPKEGSVLIHVLIAINDKRVEPMSGIGRIAEIDYSFTFDASAGGQVIETSTSEYTLAGNYTMTIDDASGVHNERVSLDGVVLEQTVSYRATGIYVNYRVKSAPRGWKDAYTEALLMPSGDSNSHFGFAAYYEIRKEAEDDTLKPGYPSSIPAGEITLILPIFPSQYEEIRKTGCGLTIGWNCVERVTGSKNGEQRNVTAGEDWSMTPQDFDEWDYDTRFQQLISVTIPLPNNH